MKKATAFQRSDAREILKHVKDARSNANVMHGEIRRGHNDPPFTRWQFVNADPADAPSYALMQVVGTIALSEATYLVCSRPVDDFYCKQAVFVANDHEPVPSGRFGVCQPGPLARVLAPPGSKDDQYAPAEGSWVAERKQGGPFSIAGTDSIRSGTVRLFLSDPVLRKAKQLKVKKNEDSDSGWEIVDYYNGDDPGECEPEYECLFDCECLKDGDEALAFLDQNTDKYFIYSSESALLGPPTTYTLVDFGDSPGNGIQFVECGLQIPGKKLKAFECNLEDPEDKTINPTLIEVPVLQIYEDSYDSTEKIRTASVFVCDWTAGDDVPIYENCDDEDSSPGAS